MYVINYLTTNSVTNSVNECVY